MRRGDGAVWGARGWWFFHHHDLRANHGPPARFHRPSFALFCIHLRSFVQLSRLNATWERMSLSPIFRVKSQS